MSRRYRNIVYSNELKVSTNLAGAYTSAEGRQIDITQLLRSSYFFEVANWLETYAEALELNVWTSSLVTHTNQDPISKYWKVTIKRGNETECVFNVKHLIFATGFGSSIQNTPKIAGAVRLSPCVRYKKVISLSTGKIQGADPTLDPTPGSHRSRGEEGTCCWCLYFWYAMTLYLSLKNSCSLSA